MRSPVSGRSEFLRSLVMKICCRSQEFVLINKHAMAIINPMSPIRL